MRDAFAARSSVRALMKQAAAHSFVRLTVNSKLQYTHFPIDSVAIEEYFDRLVSYPSNNRVRYATKVSN